MGSIKDIMLYPYAFSRSESADDKNVLGLFYCIGPDNIRCGYLLEVPRRGASNEYLNVCFCGEIRKI